jgi:myo-inositol-1(or 4)-monophosphatase
MHPPRRELIELITEWATHAGRVIVESRADASFTVNGKHGAELVTSADRAVHEHLSRVIGERFPEHVIVSEETNSRPDWSAIANGTPAWIVDPVDGTANLAHGHPLTAVAIAYVEDGETQIGVVHAPYLGETYMGVKGAGSTCNGTALTVSDTTELRDALVATGFPHVRDDLGPVARRVARLVSECRDIRRSGCPTLDICWVASGRLDAYHESAAPWDVAAAGLIAREAGAVRTHLSPRPADTPEDLFGTDIVIATPALMTELISLLGPSN